MLLCDWQIFWHRHNARPVVSAFDMEMLWLNHRAGRLLAERLAPAIKQAMAKMMAELKGQYERGNI